MCFVLYAGTTKPIMRREWQKDAPELSVEKLSDREAPIKTHFKSPEVQYIGSSSMCGCDFPHVTLHNGDWPMLDPALRGLRRTPDRTATENTNREALFKLLKETREQSVELYGIWDGNFMEGPKAFEIVLLEKILDPDFYFKEQGFYTVQIESCEDTR
jgi:hypothetical protein